VKRTLVALAYCALLACGGGSHDTPIQSPPPPSQPTGSIPPAGLYDLEISANNAVIEAGEMVIEPNGEAVFSGILHLGFGTWRISGSDAVLILNQLALGGLPQPISHSPGAHPPAEQRNIRVQKSMTSTDWFGDGVRLFSRSTNAPPLATIQRNWQYRDIIPFTTDGSNNIDYSAQIDIDVVGLLTGFDTNGCRFDGQLSERTDGMSIYALNISAFNCGATLRFIEEGQYIGSAWLIPGSNGQQATLILLAINRPQQTGIYFRLTPR